MRYFIRMLSFFSLLFISYYQSIYAQEDWLRVYLATYPRSGNHWLRNLLEETTHIATSSVYHDKEPMHLKTPFPWGGYAVKHGYEGNCRYPNPGEIVVIKTHFPAKRKTRFDLQTTVKVIRIVRHPVDAFYSHFLHTGNELSPNGKIPSAFVKKSVANWRKFENYWNRQPDVLTIRYEDLFEDIHFYFQLILEFIGYPFNEKDIDRAIEKFPPSGGLLKHLQDYHPEDLKLISETLKPLMKRYGYTIDTIAPPHAARWAFGPN